MRLNEVKMDYYFEDQSEAEQIIEEAADKLMGLISEKTKAEIEEYKNWATTAQFRTSQLERTAYEQQERINVLEIDLKRAKEELERKDNEIPKVPFMLGKKVWWVDDDYQNAAIIKCVTCHGTGRVKTQTADFGEVEITCPHCKGQRYASYEPVKAYPGYVVRSHIVLDASSDTPSFAYDLVEDEENLKRFKNKEKCYTFTEYKIYKTEDEAKKAADQETEKRKLEVEKELCLIR